MAVRSTKTTKIGGDADYAKVPDRLKLFREDCPNGLIETSPEIKEDGTIIFTARILKDKSKPESGEATGHSYGKPGNAVKAFEKLETIAVGRALALLGYLASGEIASSEEMDDFLAYKNQKVADAIGLLADAEDLDDLKKRFMTLGPLMAEEDVIAAKDAKKETFTNESN